MRPVLMCGLCVVAIACGDSGGGTSPGTDDCSPVRADAGACTDGATQDTSIVDPDTGADTDSPPPLTCNPGLPWAAGTAAYLEATEAWGLTGVEGIRFSVSDFDNDGWPDLIVRNGGGPDDFAEGGARHRWFLRNTGQGGFEDVTHQSGVLASRQDQGPSYGRTGDVIISGDVDNDGDLDIYTLTAVHKAGNLNADTSEVMLNNGDGTFVLGPEGSAARFVGQQSVPAGAAFVDFDLDGNLDLWVSHNMAGNASWPLSDRLLKGDGTGNFVDVSKDRGVKTYPWLDIDLLNQGHGHSWAWSAAACDLNNDGWPELLAASYGRAPNLLWRAVLGAGNEVAYVNESVASGYAFDHREDWTDNMSAQCHCADFPGDDECDTVPPPPSAELCASFKQSFGGSYRWNHASDREPWRLGGNSGATVCSDVNNDGFLDLMTSEIVHADVGSNSDPAELMVNTGSAQVRFERPGNEATGLTRVHEEFIWNDGDMTAVVFDFDNDGWQDIYIGASDYPGNKGLLFHQNEPLVFERLETEDYFHHNRAHGMAVADFDRDGDLDIIVGHSHMRCGGDPATDCYDTTQVRLFMNQMSQATNWIQVHLVGGQGSNQGAVGARVEVTSGGVTQTQIVDGGHGHFGTQRHRVLHFGLAAACQADVRVIWPNVMRTQQTATLTGNLRYRWVQGKEPVEVP